MIRPSPRLLSLIVPMLLNLAATSVLATPGPRAFAPVQRGPVISVETVSPYVPGRVMIKLTDAALRASHFDLPMRGGAAAGRPHFGLTGLDVQLEEVGVERVVRAFTAPANKAAARAAKLENWFQIDLPRDSDVADVAALLAADANVAEATPDIRFFPAAVPNDSRYPDNWGHNNTQQLPAYGWGTTWSHTGPGVGTVGFDANAEAAWDQTQGFGDNLVVIAILDSGVDLAHPDLDLVPGYDFGDYDNDPDDDSGNPGHGTACAGVAAAVANNAIGAAGVAGNCRIMPLKIATNAGALSLIAAANALYHAADNGVDVASMSFGADLISNGVMDAALQYAFDQGVVLLAATGNENATTIGYPAINANVIAVGAASPCGDRKRSSSNSSEVNSGNFTDPNGYTCDGERWWGSNYGSNTMNHAWAVDVIAPTILPTTDISGSGGYRSGDYEPFFNGTSCATPYAAGVCALIRSANPAWTSAQVRDRLRDTAIDVVNVESVAGWDRYSGHGMVDAAAAVTGIVILPPVADFSYDPATGCVPLTVAFSDLSSGDVATWDWDFGDGSGASVANPSHDYTLAGDYDVTLIVTGPAGADTLIVAAAISAGAPPFAVFTASPTSGPAPLGVEFTDFSVVSPLGWVWDFGDGSGPVTTRNAFHEYTTPGTYSVSLIAINACGADTLVLADHITVTEAAPPPVAGFSADTVVGCVPLDVTFSDASTGDISGRAWIFGDGGSDTVADPLHTYQRAGSFDVRLIVFGPGGADTLTMPGLVNADTIVNADFGISVAEGPNPLTVTFSDQSTGQPGNWTWDFGDAAGDTIQHPVHTYTTEGTYTVTMTAANPCGDDTMIKTDLIIVRSPSAAGDGLPARFALEQNYPNPFNPATTIAFSLAKAGHVRLELFDADGRRLDTLVDEVRAAGPHRIAWRPQTLASGVYFARLEAGGQRAVRRLVLLR